MPEKGKQKLTRRNRLSSSVITKVVLSSSPVGMEHSIESNIQTLFFDARTILFHCKFVIFLLKVFVAFLFMGKGATFRSTGVVFELLKC